MKIKLFLAICVFLVESATGYAQVNSGSDGSDGAFDFSSIAYTTNIVINMADHPTGVYQYTSVNIPSSVTVTYIPNANNAPVIWLVQSNVVINGTVDVSGQNGAGSQAGRGGPSGWNGGNGGQAASSGQGPGGGLLAQNNAGNASYGTRGETNVDAIPAGAIYGNAFIIPLIGGSGGGGSMNGYNGSSAGGGGGGAILIVSSTTIALYGSINAGGGGGANYSDGYGGNFRFGGAGSGGSIRLVTSKLIGNGGVYAGGNGGGGYQHNISFPSSGAGRIRFDVFENDFSGGIEGSFTIGSQFTIIPMSGQLPHLTVTTVGGVPVSASPSGVLSTPDAVLSAQQNNPIPVVVQCSNIPLDTQITVSVKPANGFTVSASSYNTTGTLASSTATVSIVIPRGGGLIYATAATSN